MNRKSSFSWQPFILLAALVLFLAFCMDTTAETLRRPQYLFLLISAVLLLFVFRQLVSISEAAAILLAGVALRSAYVLYTAVWTRQHDVIDFGVGEGHAGYIEYIYQNLTLPAGDPREKWAFFQPPLHHIISALWMRFCSHFEVAYRQAQENVQLLTLFYTCSVIILTFFICKELKLSIWGTRFALIIVSFHPAYIIMSGSINNDALSLALATLSLYLVILWYKKPSYKLIIMLAISIGLSMMAKLSGGTIAPAVAALFIAKLCADKKFLINLKHYIGQFIVFGVIVFPLGIWWEVKNVVKYGMPFNYIPPVGEQLDTSLLSRIFDIRTHTVYPCMISNGDNYDEYNVFLAMFKTSLFDDYNLSLESSDITLFAVILFVSGLFLAIAALIATILILKDKNNRYSLAFEHKLLFGITYISLLIAYLSFAFGSNNFSAENFRYISLIIVIEALFLGVAVDSVNNKRQLAFRMLTALVLIFAASSLSTYLLLGFAR